MSVRPLLVTSTHVRSTFIIVRCGRLVRFQSVLRFLCHCGKATYSTTSPLHSPQQQQRRRRRQRRQRRHNRCQQQRTLAKEKHTANTLSRDAIRHSIPLSNNLCTVHMMIHIYLAPNSLGTKMIHSVHCLFSLFTFHFSLFTKQDIAGRKGKKLSQGGNLPEPLKGVVEPHRCKSSPGWSCCTGYRIA